jgi:hypothetical protein
VFGTPGKAQTYAVTSARYAIVLGACTLLACDAPARQAVGNASSIIVIAEDSLWRDAGDSLKRALEPRIFTVRSERTFDVSQFSPHDVIWRDRRIFRTVLVIGPADAPWVQPVVARGGGDAVDGVVEATGVWARNQRVIALIAGDAATAEQRAARVAAVIDSAFRADVLRRMYASGPDTLLRDTLRQQYGFGVLLPTVYTAVRRDSSVVWYRNETQVGGDLVRSLLVTWRTGMHAATAEAAHAWRDSIAAQAYNPAQRTHQELMRAGETAANGAQGVEIQGVWSGTDPGWPSSGPYIARMMQCPARNRTYLLDAWVYAPGPDRSKYEYLIQLNTLLNTFEC